MNNEEVKEAIREQKYDRHIVFLVSNMYAFLTFLTLYMFFPDNRDIQISIIFGACILTIICIFINVIGFDITINKLKKQLR